VALSDRPLDGILEWRSGFDPELLQAIGNLAIVTSEIEELLHKIYWKYAGLTERSGPNRHR
jgi:hypothetical protein